MRLNAFDELLDLQEIHEDQFVAPASPDKGERMFGGQFLAQCVEGARRTVANDRNIHSLHAYFLRPGDTSEPLDIVVHRIRDGRSFSHRQVTASQANKELFTMLTSWSIELSSPNFLGKSMTSVPEPESISYTYEQFCRDQMPNPDYHRDAQSRPMDIRYINPPQHRNKSATLEDQLMWMRIIAPISESRPSHDAAVAYLSDSTLVDNILIPHGKRWQDPDFEGTSLDHAMWFHQSCNANQWLLFEQVVEWTGQGRGLTTGRIYTEKGELVATCSQEGLMRFD